jgi:hypothetical protein
VGACAKGNLVENMSRLEMNNFNSTNVELWKLNMDDIIVDRDIWVAIFGTNLVDMKYGEWVVLEREEISLIRLYLDDSVLLNDFEEKTIATICNKLGDLYHAKLLVNKLFLHKKMFSLGMGVDDYVVEHLNEFNTIMTYLI